MFDIMLEGFGAHMADSSYLLAFCPQYCVFAPILAAQISKLLFESPGRDAVRTYGSPEVAHHLSGGNLGGADTNRCTRRGACADGITSTA